MLLDGEAMQSQKRVLHNAAHHSLQTTCPAVPVLPSKHVVHILRSLTAQAPQATSDAEAQDLYILDQLQLCQEISNHETAYYYDLYST